MWGKAYLVTKGETTQLVVFIVSLDTNRTGGAGNLEAGNNGLALAGELGRALALAAGAGLELVKKRGESNLLNSGVDVQDTVETGRQNALQIQDTNLSLESRHTVNGALR